MTNDEEFAALIAGALLKASQNDVQAQLLTELKRKAEASGSLEAELIAAKLTRKRAGDFGAEFIAAALIPILIEAGRQFWAAYSKKVAEGAADALGDLTIEKLKALIARIWSKDEKLVSVDDFSKLVRAAAEKEKLAPDQIDRLIQTIYSDGMRRELGA